MQKSSLEERTGFIAARASTQERLLADKLCATLGVKSHSALVRTLIASKAEALDIN